MTTLTQERLKELLNYDPETGVFTWKVRPARRVQIGDAAGHFGTHGYRYLKLKQIRYCEHRLVWFYVHGVWPKHEIDHIDGDKANNRIANLRDVTRSVNVQNRRSAQGNNLCGFLGVQLNGKNWSARIQTDGQVLRLGTFGTPEEAHQVYLAAKRKLHVGNTL